MTQQNAALVEESSTAASQLQEQSERLSSLVAAFTLTAHERGLPRRPTPRLRAREHSILETSQALSHPERG
ncbi:hypothetical protein [Halomonas sp. WWR20]